MKRQILATLVLALLFTAQTALADNVSYYDPTAAEGQQTKTADATAINSTIISLGEVGQTTWYYVSGTVINSYRIYVDGTVNIILTDGCQFNAPSGIRVFTGNTLNIYAQKAGSGCGTLNAQKDENVYIGGNAAIGGDEGADSGGGPADNGQDSGTINIYGGNINTRGNIGGGNGGYGHDWYEPGQEDPETQEMTEGFTIQGEGGNGGSGFVNIYGGVITVAGSIGGGKGGDSDMMGYGLDGGGTVRLTWTNTSDRYEAEQYYGTVTLDKDFEGFPSGDYDNGVLRDGSNVYEINRKTLTSSAVSYYDITLGGSHNPACLSLSQSKAKSGDDVTLTAVNGYTVNSISVKDVDNGDVALTDNNNGTWTFSMPAKGVTVTPTATRTHYPISSNVSTVSLVCNASDKLEQNDITYYRADATVQFTLTPPDARYELQSLSVKRSDNNAEIDPVQSGNTYSFTMPTASVTVSDSWTQTAFRIYKESSMSLSASTGGLVVVNGDNYYRQGSTITVEVTVPDGQEIKSFSVQNNSTYAAVPFTDKGNNTFEFTMPAGNVSLGVSFREKLNFTWTFTDEDGDGNEETLTISGSGAMNDFANYYDIPWYDFQGDIKAVVIGKDITAIGKEAFYNCTNLESVTFEANSQLTSISDYAFMYCSTLESFTIPASVTTIGQNAFVFSGLTAFHVEAGNTTFKSEGGVLFNKVGTTLLAYPCGNTATSYVIPNGVTTISDYAFYSCEKLTTVVFPANLTTIGESAFYECIGLTSVTIPSKVTNIGSDAFFGCYWVTNVYCYADPEYLTWKDVGYDDFNYEETPIDDWNYDYQRDTKCHVFADKIDAFRAKWSTGNSSTDVNVEFVNDLATSDDVTTNSADGAYWSTYYNNNGNVKAAEGVKVYTAKLSGDQIEMTEVTDRIIKAGEGVILKAASADAITVSYTSEAAGDFYADNELKGVDVATSLADILAANPEATAVYVLNKKGDDPVGFYKLSATGTLAANKAYLATSSSGDASNFNFYFEDETTSLIENGALSIENSGAWYTLDGRRLQGKPTQMGVYIMNGRKYVIK